MTLPHLTFAYVTNRPEPRIEWFFQSLSQQVGGVLENMTIVVADFCKGTPGRDEYVYREFDAAFPGQREQLRYSMTKPSVWQGEHRLTTRDFYAYSSARNTALCLAPDGWLACVDDLGVLMPGWVNGAREAMAGGYIACAAYKKVLDLSYQDRVLSFTAHPPGVDTRWKSGSDTGPVQCWGSWMYGYAVIPIARLLEINGWDEDADCCGTGGGDYIAGLMMQAHGADFAYDRRMVAIEDETLHFQVNGLIRKAEHAPGRLDNSCQLLDMVQHGGRVYSPNYFGPGGIRAERERVLSGAPFTIPQIPQHSWYSGIPLAKL